MKKWLIFLGCFCSIALSWAQYDLTEVGVLAGGGLAPVVNGSLQSGPGLNANAFYSFWFCGKNRGIHGSLGVRHAQYGSKDALAPLGALRFTYLDAGFYFKLRLHEYHRKKELFFLMGPKLNVALASSYSGDLGKGPLSETVHKTSPLLGGVEASAIYKYLAGSQFLYFQGGATYYPTPFFSESAGPSASGLYIFANVGITAWNSKQKSYKRK